MKHHIFVTVQGGVAEVCEDTLAPEVVVEILDFDNLAADGERGCLTGLPNCENTGRRTINVGDDAEQGVRAVARNKLPQKETLWIPSC
jgi:hypothetical protein